ncbi:MAG: hypothetical protein GKR90_25250 [Pseudomonadales bacterium]|nr:hypothetical protein [Pseudomonadales bacterium]
MLIRRVIGITLVLLATITLIPIAPIVILVCFLIARSTSLKSLDRAVLFAYGFLFFEIAGISLLIWAGVRHRDPAIVQAKSYDVQRWWASGLFNMASRLFNLSFKVTGHDAINGAGAILISRHTNIADNIFPIVFVSAPRNEPVRYILKKELMNIPSLDIGGHRLPNLFIDRSGVQTENELRRVRELMRTCSEADSLLIYPEGTRFSPKKQQAIAQRPGMLEQTQRWPSLLPPRLGGIGAILEENQNKDAVFLCHNGFEGSGGFYDLLDGSWINKDIELRFWRIPFAEIGPDSQTFIFTQWDRMQAELEEMRSAV